MRPASNDAHNETNDTKGVRIGLSRGELDSSNEIIEINVHLILRMR